MLLSLHCAALLSAGTGVPAAAAGGFGGRAVVSPAEVVQDWRPTGDGAFKEGEGEGEGEGELDAASVEALLSRKSFREVQQSKRGEELLELLQKPTAKETAAAARVRRKGEREWGWRGGGYEVDAKN